MRLQTMLFPVVAIALAILLPGCAQPADTVYRNPYSSPHELYQGIFDAAKHDLSGVEQHRIRALIVPHHLVAAESIALGIRALAMHQPKRIVLLAPDHFGRCPTHLCTTHGSFDTTFGNVKVDTAGADRIGASAIGMLEPALFEQEHGIHAVLPFIARALSGTTIVPVVLSQRTFWQIPPAELRAAIGQLLDDDTALVVSSDFSHYLRLSMANKRDAQTMITFLARDLDGIRTLNNPEQNDCPGCLWLLADLAGSGGWFNPSILLHTNSAVLLNEPDVQETTSHFAIAFYQDTALSPDDVAIGGDVTFARTGTAAISLSPVLKAFWAGTGERIVNLEGPVATHCLPNPNPYILCNATEAVRVNAALATRWGTVNNHMLDLGARGPSATMDALQRIGEQSIPSTDTAAPVVLAATAVMNTVPSASTRDADAEYRRVLAALHNATGKDLTIVLVHIGTEFSAVVDKADARYLRSFIDAGADAVVAMHSHVPGDMEIYKGKPIFRGLGNFVFDQRDTVPTSTAKVVRLRKDANGITRFETLVAR